jgi:hypothetical protein
LLTIAEKISEGKMLNYIKGLILGDG